MCQGSFVIVESLKSTFLFTQSVCILWQSHSLHIDELFLIFHCVHAHFITQIVVPPIFVKILLRVARIVKAM